MSLKRHAITLAAALLVAAYAPSVYAEVKVAVVDIQRAMNETEDGQRAKAQLKRLFKQRQDQLDAKQEELKKAKDELDKQKNVLSREAFQKKLDSYQQSFVELQTVYVEYQRELATKEGELTQKILERMQDILRRVGQAQGYTVILERNEGGVVWAPSHIDLTDDLIQRYNSENASNSGTATPKKSSKKPN